MVQVEQIALSSFIQSLPLEMKVPETNNSSLGRSIVARLYHFICSYLDHKCWPSEWISAPYVLPEMHNYVQSGLKHSRVDTPSGIYGLAARCWPNSAKSEHNCSRPMCLSTTMKWHVFVSAWDMCFRSQPFHWTISFRTPDKILECYDVKCVR